MRCDSSRTTVRRILGLALLASLLTACASEPDGDGAAVVEPGSEQHIEWFAGDVETAFELAGQEGRPLFLYWGAEWCPPCHYLKNKIFERPEFVAKSRDFLCVYLDGDTERAQILGEELGVMGYPTVIIFSPDGEELMRMPSGIPVERYADVLDAARTAMRPVGEVLAGVMEAGPAEAASSDLYLLAFYSWDQDDKIGLGDAEIRRTFARLYRETPAGLPLERSRFLTLYLESLPAGGSADAAPALTAEERDELRAAVLDLLDDPELARANLLWLEWSSRETVELLTFEASPEREELVARWVAAAAKLEESTELSAVDRVAALLPAIHLAGLETGRGQDEETRVSSELQDRVRRRVAWAVETVTDEGELQSVMNTVGYLLVGAGLEDEAEELLTAKMADTQAPYYFMSWIGGMKADAGEPEEALVWYRRAYDEATGRYTRFRWGSIYLRRLLALAPDEEARIEDESREVLGELLTFEDAFAGGNYSRLEQLEGALLEWNADGGRQATVDALRQLVTDSCERYPAAGEDSQRSRCRGFLGTQDAVSAL